MTTLKAGLRAAYRFKPGRTFAQALGAAIGTSPVTGIAWPDALAISAGAGLVSFLMIWSEGGDLLADDSRVTGTKE